MRTTTTLTVTPRLRRAVTLLACLTALALALAAPSADAFFGGMLPRYSTTESGYEVAGMTGMYGGTGNGGNVCIGPSGYNGRIYFPYGYACGNPVAWSFPRITAHIGAYNPNGFQISFGIEPT